MIKRFIFSVVSLFIVLIISFLLNESSPKDYSVFFGGTSINILTKEAIKNIDKRYNLDKDIYQRFSIWFMNFISGNFGKSMVTNREIKIEFTVRFFPTFIIAVFSIFLSIIISIFLSILSVISKKIDFIIRIFSNILISIPIFIIFLLILIFVSPLIPSLPIIWDDNFENYILPISIMSIYNATFISRILRNKLLEVIHKEYFVAALSRGNSFFQALIKHAFINCITTLISISGIRFIGLLSGLIIIESIFSIPGIGSYIYEAILNRDLPVIQFYIAFIGIFVIIINLLVDVVVYFLNPKNSEEIFS